MKKKIISLILALALCLSALPFGAIALATGLCEHHTEHIDCGYIEGESPCGYSCAECAAAAVPAHLSGDQPTEPEAEQSAEPEAEQPTEPEQPAGPTEPACTCGVAEGEAHGEDCALYEAPAEPECTCEAADGEVHTEGCPQYTEPETTVCSCAAADETHGEDCPLYTAPAEPETEESLADSCTCETDDPAIHATNCPAYVAPENPECFCAEKCTEDNINKWCDVCGVQGMEACEGTDTAVPYADTYTVTIDDNITNGSVTADKTEAAENDTVTLTVTPHAGYELDSLTVTDISGTAVTVTDNTFTMPTGNVTVTATFKAAEAIETSIYVGGYTDYVGGYTDTDGTTAKPISTNTKYVVAAGGTVSVSEEASSNYFMLTGDENTGYTLTVTGEVTITQVYTTGTGSSAFSTGIRYEGTAPLTIAGGTLNMGTEGTQLDGSGIYTTKGNLTINGATINMNCEQAGIRANGANATLTIASGTVTAQSLYAAGIYSYGTFVMNGGTLETSGNYYGIFADNNITLDGGVVNTSGEKGIQMGSDGTFSLSDNVHLKAEGTDAAISVNQEAADLSNLTTGTSYYWRTGTGDQFIAKPVYGISGMYFEYVGADHVTVASDTISCADGCPIKIDGVGIHTHTVDPTYSANDDSTKHNKTYSCCNHTVVEEHSIDPTSGKCACGVTSGASVTAGGETTYYDSLTSALSSDAVREANSTDTIVKLLTDADYSEGDAPNIDYSLTLDLNGRTITTPWGGWSFSSNGSIIIRDSAGSGKITTSGTSKILDFNIDNLTLQSGTIGEEDSWQAIGISVYGSQSFTMTGGTVYGLSVDTGSNVTLGTGVTIGGMGLIFGADTLDEQSYVTVNGQPNGKISVDKTNTGVFAKPGSGVTLDPAWFTAPEGYAVVQEGNDLALRKRITDEMVALSETEYTYNGSEQNPTVTVTGEDNSGDAVALTANTDYTVSYKRGENVTTDCTSAGVITVVVTGTGDYTGIVEKTYTIKTAALTVTGATATNREYNGTSTVAITGITLSGVIGSDAVSVDITNLTGTLTGSDVGTYNSVTLPTLTLTGDKASNYTLTQPTGAVTTNVTISQKSISDAVITLGDSLTYTGQQQTQTISSVTVDGRPLTENTDYTVSGNTGTDAKNDYELTITGKDNYTGSKTVTFEITKADPTFTVPTGLNATYGQTLADVTLNPATGDTPGAWAWDSGNTTSVGNVGDNKFSATFTPTDENYNTKTVELTVSVSAKQVTITGLTAVNRDYNGENTVTLSGGSPEGVVGSDNLTIDLSGAVGTMADANAGDNKAVTVTGVKLGGTSAANYKLITQPTGVTVNIGQITATESATLSVLYNETSPQPVDLLALLKALSGWVEGNTPNYGTPSKSSDKIASASINDGNLSVTLAGNLTASDKERVPVTVEVTGLTNYSTVTITVTVDITDKKVVTVDASGVSVTGKTYDGQPVSVSGTPTGSYDNNGTPADYTGTLEAVYTGTLADGTAYAESTTAPTDAGSYQVYFRVPTNNATYTGDSSAAPIAFTISQKQLSWTTGGITVKDQAYEPGKTTVDSVTGSPTLDGVVSEDTVNFTVTGTTYAFADDKPGTDKTITATVTGLTLTGADTGNYLAPPATYTLKGDITAPNTGGGENAEIVPGEGTTLIVTKEADLPSNVSYYGDDAKAALETKFGTDDTIGEIKVHMEDAGEDAIAAMTGVDTGSAQVTVLEISLKYWDTAKSQWVKITEDNLNLVPQGGVDVVIPYSLFGFTDVTNRSNYKFVVKHMITLPIGNQYAIGDVEDLSGAVTVTADGLKMKVEHGFSPFVVGFAKTSTGGGTDPGGSGSGGSSSPSRTPPVIIDPANDWGMIVYVGETATLDITALRADSYQWYVDRGDGRGFVPIPGATGPSYTTSPVTMDNDGYVYRCVAMNAYGQATSPTITLQVIDYMEIPKTGDNSRIGLYIGLMMIGLAGIGYSAFMMCRRKRES